MKTKLFISCLKIRYKKIQVIREEKERYVTLLVIELLILRVWGISLSGKLNVWVDHNKTLSFAVWLWASLQFCFSCTSDDDFLDKERIVSCMVNFLRKAFYPSRNEVNLSLIQTKTSKKPRVPILCECFNYLKRKVRRIL